MLFKVKDKKNNKEYGVYSVQGVMAQNLAGQPVPAMAFFIYDDEKSRWDLRDANDFEPVVSKIAIK